MRYLFIMVFSISCLLSVHAQANGQLLNSEGLRKTVTGKTIFLPVALGVELPIRYRPGGKMTGKISKMIKIIDRSAPLNDKGRWWVKNNQLCQKWRNWLDGRSFCYRIKKIGAKKVQWYRNDGKSGTARISSH